MSSPVHFFGFVSTEGVARLRPLGTLPTPSMIHDVRSFHGLTTFREGLLGEIKWFKSIARTFEKIKEKLTTTLVLYLLIFSKVLEVACDAFGHRYRWCIKPREPSSRFL